jgi:hypothetical protein
MNPSVEIEAERLFPLFVDPVDMVGCWRADATLMEINRDVAEHRLRFPFGCDPAATLGMYVKHFEYASQSARFGPLADNILGMNWTLKSGTVIRIGEQVIKSATGYELLRFLLHSDGRYGEAASYVLRLRPDGGENCRAILRGSPEALDRVRSNALKSPWIHWIDSVDYCLSPRKARSLEFSANCLKGEGALFEAFFQQLGDRDCDYESVGPLREVRALPSLGLKATCSSAIRLAERIVEKHGGEARVLCVNGVVEYYPVSPSTFSAESVRAIVNDAVAEGGHAFGPRAPKLQPSDEERAWSDELEESWNRF